MQKKVALVPIGLIVLFFGSIWFLQGIGILPGSIMSGSSFWAVTGGLADIIGIALIITGGKGVKSK